MQQRRARGTHVEARHPDPEINPHDNNVIDQGAGPRSRVAPWVLSTAALALSAWMLLDLAALRFINAPSVSRQILNSVLSPVVAAKETKEVVHKAWNHNGSLIPQDGPAGVCKWSCYLERYPDLKEAFGDSHEDAAEHYHTMGRGEGRNCQCDGEEAVTECSCGKNLFGTCIGKQGQCKECNSWDSFPKLQGGPKQYKTAELVVGHCNKQDLSWLASAMKELTAAQLVLTKVFIYSKCGKQPATFPPGAEMHMAHNRGRNHHTWALHMARRYTELSDLVFFFEDNTFDHPIQELVSLVTGMRQLIQNVVRDSFACVQKPQHGGSLWHLRRELWRFRAPWSAVGLSRVPKLQQRLPALRLQLRVVGLEGALLSPSRQLFSEITKTLKEGLADHAGHGISPLDITMEFLPNNPSRVQVLLVPPEGINARSVQARLEAKQAQLAPSLARRLTDVTRAAHFSTGVAALDGTVSVHFITGVELLPRPKAQEDLGTFQADVSMCHFIARALSVHEVAGLLQHELLPVCYGGSFAVTREAVLRYRRQSWRNFAAALTRGHDIEEVHYMERIWAGLLAPQLSTEQEDELLHHAEISAVELGDFLGRTSVGMLKSCCCSGSAGRGDISGVLMRARRTAEMLNTSHLTPMDPINNPAVPNGAQRLHVSLAFHSWDVDGPGRWLQHVAGWFLGQKHFVSSFSPSAGPLQEDLKQQGSLTTLLQKLDWDSPRIEQDMLEWRDTLLSKATESTNGWAPHMVLWNSVRWAPIIAANEQECLTAPRFLWVLHEFELRPEVAMPDGFWWGLQFPQLQNHRLRNTLTRADAVVFTSSLQRELWGEHDTGNFFTLRGHVNRPQNSSSAAEAQPMRELLGIPTGAFVMTAVGSYREQKRQLWLIQALQAVLRLGADAWLLLIGLDSSFGGGGEPQYVERVKAAAKEPLVRGRVLTIPFGSENAAEPYLQLSSLHLSASVQETYPLNTLEAMAFSIPVIATAAGGTEEQFPTKEVDWMVVRDLADPKAFVATVQKAHELYTRGQLQLLGQRLKSEVADPSSKSFYKSLGQILEHVLGHWQQAIRKLGEAAVCDLSESCWRIMAH